MSKNAKKRREGRGGEKVDVLTGTKDRDSLQIPVDVLNCTGGDHINRTREGQEMDIKMRKDADAVVAASIKAVQPDEAVARALAGQEFPGRVLLVAAGKAAWQMAKAASDCMGERIEAGVVVTKYDHVLGPIANYDCREAGHPVPDENSFAGTQAALDLVTGLKPEDTVLFLLSGGGSALFEKPLIPGEILQDVTKADLPRPAPRQRSFPLFSATFWGTPWT